MSHVLIAEIKEQKKLLFIMDSTMNIMPDLEQKAAIILNAVHLNRLLIKGIRPYGAIIRTDEWGAYKGFAHKRKETQACDC